MPLPLIPVAIMLAAAGSGGIGAGADGVRRMSKAQTRQTAAHRRHASASRTAKAAWQEADRHVNAYGEFQLQVQRDTLGDFARWLEENERRVRRTEGAFVDGIEVEKIDLPGLQVQAFEAEPVLRGGLTAVMAGVAARQAALTAVRTAATAGTGAAISSLSGAAGNGAVLAWLGGGTLASGGGGMAAGATVLTGVGAVPAVIITGLTLNAQGHRAITRARRVEAETAIAIAQLRTQRDLLDRVKGRVDELHGVLQALDGRARASLAQLQSVDFDPDEHVEIFMHTAQLIRALREVLATPLFTADGNLTTESSRIVIRHAQSN